MQFEVVPHAAQVLGADAVNAQHHFSEMVEAGVSGHNEIARETLDLAPRAELMATMTPVATSAARSEFGGSRTVTMSSFGEMS
jgi:hypothetical protein